MKRLLPILLLLCSTAGASNYARVRTITSLPFTIATGDSIVFSFAGHKATTSGGFCTAAYNCTNAFVNFGQDTIQWGTGNGSDVNGIYLADCNHLTFYGGVITRNQGSGMSAGSGNHGIHINSPVNYVLFDSMQVVIDGHNARCVTVDQSQYTYNLDFYRCVFYDSSVSFTTRVYYGGAAIGVGGPGNNGSYDARIRNCKVVIAPQCAIAMDNGRLWVQNCSLLVDAQNKYWDSVYLDQGQHTDPGPSADNCFVVLTRNARAGTTIHDNVILSGSNHQGSRGILLENATGTASVPITVYNNYIDEHSGPTGENLQGNAKAIRVRSIDGGAATYIYIHDNTIIQTLDTFSNTPAYGVDGSGILWECYSGGSGTTGHIRVENNNVRVRSRTQGTYGRALEIASLTGDTAGMTFTGNTAYSSGTVVNGTDYDNSENHVNDHGVMSATDYTIKNNRFGFIPASDSFVQMTDRHMWDWGCTNPYTGYGNVAIDNVFDSGAVDSDFRTFGPASLRLKKTVTISVIGNNGGAVEGAYDTLTDALGRVQGTGMTVGGLSSIPVTYRYRSNTVDSNGFNPFSLIVHKGTARTVQAVTVTSSMATVYDTLDVAGIQDTDIAMGSNMAASEGGGFTMDFIVTQNRMLANANSYTVTATNGTAIAGVNYTDPSGTYQIAANSTKDTITVTTIRDYVYYGNRTFTITISSPTYGSISNATATGTINELDSPPVISSGPRVKVRNL